MKITDVYSTDPYVEIVYHPSTEWQPNWNESLEPPVTVEVRLNSTAIEAITWAFDQKCKLETLQAQLGANPMLDQAIKNYQDALSTVTMINTIVGNEDAQ